MILRANKVTRDLFGPFSDEQWRLVYKQAYDNLVPVVGLSSASPASYEPPTTAVSDQILSSGNGARCSLVPVIRWARVSTP